jgi:hypothetical protein
MDSVLYVYLDRIYRIIWILWIAGLRMKPAMCISFREISAYQFVFLLLRVTRYLLKFTLKKWHARRFFGFGRSTETPPIGSDYFDRKFITQIHVPCDMDSRAFSTVL